MTYPSRPTIPVPEWCTTNDPYASPGEEWDGEARKADPGALAVSGYEPEEEPGAQEHNYHENAQGQWLKHLAAFALTAPILNWGPEIDLGGGADEYENVLLYSVLTESWIALGDNGTMASSTYGDSWSADNYSDATYDFYFALAATIDADISIVATNKSDKIAFYDAGVWDDVTTTAGDKWWALCEDPETDRFVFAGTIDGAPDTALFGYGTDLATITRHTSLTTVGTPTTVYIASNGSATDCKIAVLISDGTTVDMFRSSDGGTTWAKTADVLEGGLIALAYDPKNDQFVAITSPEPLETRGVFTCPAGQATWTHIASPGFTGSLPGGKLLIVGDIWVGNFGTISYSLDSGLNWYDIPAASTLGPIGHWLAYSPLLGQWGLLRSVTNDARFFRSWVGGPGIGPHGQ